MSNMKRIKGSAEYCYFHKSASQNVIIGKNVIIGLDPIILSFASRVLNVVIIVINIGTAFHKV